MKSRVHGVTWDPAKDLWSASMTHNGYAQHLGWYKTETLAAEAIWTRIGHANRDAGGFDIEQDERWDHVAGSDFHPSSPDRVRTRGVVHRPDRLSRQPLTDPTGLSGSVGSPSF